MDHLEKIAVEDLQQAFDKVEGKKPIQRLIAAIAYKNGVSQTELATWYGIERKTVYNWLTRFDDDPVNPAQAARDAPRPGRPRKLTDEQYEQLRMTLRNPPSAAGYDAPAWTPALVRRYVQDSFNEKYSTESCRRILREIGLD